LVLPPLLVLHQLEAKIAFAEKEQSMQLAPHLRLERQLELVGIDQLLLEQPIAVALARRRRRVERALVRGVVEDAHLDQHLADHLRRAGQRHRHRKAVAEIQLVPPDARLEAQHARRAILVEPVQQVRQRLVLQASGERAHRRPPRAAYHSASITTAQTAAPVAIGSASIDSKAEAISPSIRYSRARSCISVAAYSFDDREVYLGYMHEYCAARTLAACPALASSPTRGRAPTSAIRRSRASSAT